MSQFLFANGFGVRLRSVTWSEDDVASLGYGTLWTYVEWSFGFCIILFLSCSNLTRFLVLCGHDG